MIKLPSPIRISAVDVKMSLVKGIKEDLELLGDYKEDQGSYTIRVDASIPPILLLDTLIHEISHAIIDIYHINLKGEVEEEQLVLQLGSAWAQIYRDSPELLDYMRGLV